MPVTTGQVIYLGYDDAFGRLFETELAEGAAGSATEPAKVRRIFDPI